MRRRRENFEDLSSCLKEMMRLIKKYAIVVILTADPRLRKEIWVDKYFGFLVDSAREVYLPIQDLLEELQPYALGNIDVETVMLPDDIEDLNRRGAYLHVLADALVSVLVILALIIGMFIPSLVILDPLIGIIAGLVIAKWSLSLMSESKKQLLGLS